ncbi:transposase [Leptospira alexanderi serovar Manhao 3 str. L 60]|uniref:Transposase n=1 Tax=Leptospira alexanderi serovar Manhao 3 str. L 60 TaxID=1049759 RepID=V6HSC3_9LEPT|nr:transposase [Leptospira alexanderi serovar Manhao 3 str. L 60]
MWKEKFRVVRINSENSLERRQFSTTESGINNLLKWLTLNDIVGLEAGSQSFRIAKSILNKGIQVIVLNPGDLATIYQSLKKTDKEDSLKIARLIQRFPIEELPVVPIPTTRLLGSVMPEFLPTKRKTIEDFARNMRTGQDN